MRVTDLRIGMKVRIKGDPALVLVVRGIFADGLVYVVPDWDDYQGGTWEELAADLEAVR